MADVVNATPGAVETAPDAGAEHKYVFNVSMSCGGCSGAVDRVLKKLEGTVSLSLPPSPPFSSRGDVHLAAQHSC